MTYAWARRIAILVVGGTVVLMGVIMIVTPGPAVVVIPAGLAILALEFAWARRWLDRLKKTAGTAYRMIRPDKPANPPGGDAGPGQKRDR